MDPRLEEIAADYRSGKIDRRVCIKRMIAILGSYNLVYYFLERSGWAMSVLSPQESQAVNVDSAAVTYPGEGATLQGYLSRPRSGGQFPAMILIHAVNGLNEHLRDVARRFASEGFVALAVDLLSRQGGTGAFPTPDGPSAAFRRLSDDQVVQDLDAAYRYLNSHASVRRDRIGAMGFCWGGQRTFLYATANPNLKAAVVFYGSAPPEERMARIQAPVLGHYGEKDTPITSKVADVEAAMKRLGKSYDPKIYPGAEHTFFNDTGERYHEAAAKDAWARTLAFLRTHLS